MHITQHSSGATRVKRSSAENRNWSGNETGKQRACSENGYLIASSVRASELQGDRVDSGLGIQTPCSRFSYLRRCSCSFK